MALLVASLNILVKASREHGWLSHIHITVPQCHLILVTPSPPKPFSQNPSSFEFAACATDTSGQTTK